MPMFFISLDGLLNDERVRLRVWVSAGEEAAARLRVRNETKRLAISDVVIEACEITTREDYFPPCESLATFERAKREGLAYLVAPR